MALAVAEGANEHAKDDYEPAGFTTVRHSKGKHIKGLIGRPPAAVVPVKAPDAPLPGPKASKGGVKHAAAGTAVNAAVSAAVIDGDRVEEAIPAKPRPGLKGDALLHRCLHVLFKCHMIEQAGTVLGCAAGESAFCSNFALCKMSVRIIGKHACFVSMRGL